MSVTVDALRNSLPTPRQRSVWWPALVLSVITGLLVFWILVSSDGPLELVVRGQQRADVDALRQRTLPMLDAGLFAVSPRAVERELEALPWVDAAHVARRFPNRLVARVIEHQVVAQWGDDALISATGVIFQPAVASWPADLPRLSGPPERRMELLETWVSVSDALGGDAPALAGIAIDQRGSWTAELADGVVLHLGRAGIDDRMARFAGPTRRALAQRWDAVAAIDLRYTNGFAVSWRQPEQQPARGT